MAGACLLEVEAENAFRRLLEDDSPQAFIYSAVKIGFAEFLHVLGGFERMTADERRAYLRWHRRARRSHWKRRYHNNSDRKDLSRPAADSR